MADVSIITANGINYNIKDATARTDITSLQGDMTDAQGDIISLQGDMTTAQGNITALQTQVSGLVTGGSNYVKLADGTMLEWGTGSASHASSGVLTQSVSFPQAFYATPCVVIGLAAGEPEYENVSAAPSTSGFTASTYSSYSGGNTIYFAWFAIGRWKA